MEHAPYKRKESCHEKHRPIREKNQGILFKGKNYPTHETARLYQIGNGWRGQRTFQVRKKDIGRAAPIDTFLIGLIPAAMVNYHHPW